MIFYEKAKNFEMKLSSKDECDKFSACIPAG